jgi:hypothetical protein
MPSTATATWFARAVGIACFRTQLLGGTEMIDAGSADVAGSEPVGPALSVQAATASGASAAKRYQLMTSSSGADGSRRLTSGPSARRGR